MKTSTCVLHVTDLAGCRRTSMCVLHVTDREGVCRGVSSGSEGRTALRRKIDERDTVPVLLVRWGFGGIWRNHATGSMLWNDVNSFQGAGRSGSLGSRWLFACIRNRGTWKNLLMDLWGFRRTPHSFGRLCIIRRTYVRSRMLRPSKRFASRKFFLYVPKEHDDQPA